MNIVRVMPRDAEFAGRTTLCQAVAMSIVCLCKLSGWPVTHNTTLQGKMPMRGRNSAQRGNTRGMEKKIVARDSIEEDSYDGP